jgi:hypothetical protein
MCSKAIHTTTIASWWWCTDRGCPPANPQFLCSTMSPGSCYLFNTLTRWWQATNKLPTAKSLLVANNAIYAGEKLLPLLRDVDMVFTQVPLRCPYMQSSSCIITHWAAPDRPFISSHAGWSDGTMWKCAQDKNNSCMVCSPAACPPAHWPQAPGVVQDHSCMHTQLTCCVKSKHRLYLLLNHLWQVLNKAGSAINALAIKSNFLWAGLEGGVLWRCAQTHTHTRPCLCVWAVSCPSPLLASSHQ